MLKEKGMPEVCVCVLDDSLLFSSVLHLYSTYEMISFPQKKRNFRPRGHSELESFLRGIYHLFNVRGEEKNIHQHQTSRHQGDVK